MLKEIEIKEHLTKALKASETTQESRDYKLFLRGATFALRLVLGYVTIESGVVRSIKKQLQFNGVKP